MSILEVEPRQYAPEDLLSMVDGDRFELVDGQLVERKMGWKASWIGGRLFYHLSAYCEANPIGWVAGADASYQCFPRFPSRVRRPDVSFIQMARLPSGEMPEGHCRIAPDLAVEVVSPNDFYSEIEEKVDEYLSAGIRLVWVIDPPTRSARVHRAGGSVADLKPGDELDGEDVVPGFRCPLEKLFRTPEEGKADPGPSAP